MRLILTLTLISTVTACGPKCLKGHEELVWVEKECYLRDIFAGHTDMGPVFIEECEPRHQEVKFLCDEYEVEREK